MATQTLNIPILYTLMGFFLDFFVSLFRGIAKMSAPLYYYNGCMKSSQFTQEMNPFLIQRHQQQQTTQLEAFGKLENGTKMLLQTLQSPQLEIYSIEYVSRPLLYSSDTTNSSVLTPTKKCDAQKEPQVETCDAINQPYKMCSEPTFCYFFVDVHPHKFVNDKCQTSNESSTVSTRHCIRKSSNESCITPLDDAQEDVFSTQKMYNQPLATVYSQPPVTRQRSISECSEDSFICFVDDDNEDGDYMNDHQRCVDNDSDDDSHDEYDESTDEDSDDADVDDDDYDDNCADKIQTKTDCQTQSNIKKVRFNLNPEVHVMHTWDFAYRSARKGDWQLFARDHARFQQRIQRTAVLLEPVLLALHRQKVYEERFNLQQEDF